MNEEDLKIMIFRAEKAAFILGKIGASVFALSERFNAGPLTEELKKLRDEIVKDCGELYYPVEYYITKEVSNEKIES